MGYKLLKNYVKLPVEKCGNKLKQLGMTVPGSWLDPSKPAHEQQCCY